MTIRPKIVYKVYFWRLKIATRLTTCQFSRMHLLMLGHKNLQSLMPRRFPRDLSKFVPYVQALIYWVQNWKTKWHPWNFPTFIIFSIRGDEIKYYLLGYKFSSTVIKLTPTLSAWRLSSHLALKLILWETLFLDQLHDFSLLSLYSFLQLFSKSKFM